MDQQITIIQCGRDEEAPAWWSPDSDISVLEAIWIDGMMREQEREMLAMEAEVDRRERLQTGPCDLCQEPCSIPLVEVDGEAVCVGCVGALGLDYNEVVELGRAPGDGDELGMWG